MSGAWAQERIVGSRSIGVGTSFESVSFSGRGLAQGGFAGTQVARISSAGQFTLPVSVATPISTDWRLDVTALLAYGAVTYVGDNGIERTARLSGVSDVRVRATGPLLRDGITVTLGANVPTGKTSLDAEQFSVLRILSAPALGLGSTAVGSGPSGTAGIVVSRPIGRWSMAAGASYEYRGTYQPIAALTAGAPSADFQPGGVIRGSLTADRPVGSHRLSLATAVDVFSTDRLRAQAGGTAGQAVDAATVRLGPVLSGDAQLQIAAAALRSLLVYSSLRYRAPFSRDGERVGASEGTYVETGARAVRALARSADAVLALDGRWHSGLGVNQGLPTNGVTSVGATLGVHLRRALLSVQPYVRAQVGSLRPTGDARDTGSQGFGGASAGLVVVSRF
jgi:hypothetical protein